MKKKAEFGILLGTVFILILFLWGPTSYYLGRWNDYWSGQDVKTETALEFYDAVTKYCFENQTLYFGQKVYEVKCK